MASSDEGGWFDANQNLPAVLRKKRTLNGRTFRFRL